MSFVRTRGFEVVVLARGAIAGVDPLIVVTRCVLRVLDLGRLGGAGMVEAVDGGLGERDDDDAVGFEASLASYTQFAIVLRAVVRSTARFAYAKSPFEPTTWMMRSGDMFRRSSVSQQSASSERNQGND